MLAIPMIYLILSLAFTYLTSPGVFALLPPSILISAPFIHLSLYSSRMTKFLAYAALTCSASTVYGKRSSTALEYKYHGDSVLGRPNQRFSFEVILLWILSITVTVTV